MSGWRSPVWAFGFLILSGIAVADPDGGDLELRQPAVTVTGSRQEQATTFVKLIKPDNSASARRGVPRWDSELCVSVIGPAVEQGQFIADRITQRALDVGLEAGAGCDTNLLVIVTNDPDTLLPVVAERHRALFGFTGDANIDTSGSDDSLAAFLSSDLPVRWRQVVKTVGANGMPLDGDPVTNSFSRSQQDPRWSNPVRSVPINRIESTRLRATVRRQVSCVVAVVDTRRTAGIGLGAISDYLALVTLADVSPDANLASFPSILNLFNADGEAQTEMSDWDHAFLVSLYSARLTGANGAAQYREIAGRVAEYEPDRD